MNGRLRKRIGADAGDRIGQFLAIPLNGFSQVRAGDADGAFGDVEPGWYRRCRAKQIMIDAKRGRQRHGAKEGESAQKHNPGGALGRISAAKIVARVFAGRRFDYLFRLLCYIQITNPRTAPKTDLANAL